MLFGVRDALLATCACHKVEACGRELVTGSGVDADAYAPVSFMRARAPVCVLGPCPLQPPTKEELLAQEEKHRQHAMDKYRMASNLYVDASCRR